MRMNAAYLTAFLVLWPIAVRGGSGDAIVGIYPLRSSIATGEEAEVVVVLPPAGAAYDQWALYWQGAAAPLYQGSLSTSKFIEPCRITATEDGNRMVILLIKDAQGRPRLVATAPITVECALLDRVLEGVAGVVSASIVGALLALCVFVIQNRIQSTHERIRRRAELSGLMRQFLESTLIQIEDGVEVPRRDWNSAPGWLEGMSMMSTTWRESALRLTARLDAITVRWNAGRRGKDEKQLARAEIQDLLSSVKY